MLERMEARLNRLIERFREERDLNMIFIDLEKTYDKIPREVTWNILEKKPILINNI